LKTTDLVRTKWGGSEAVPRTPNEKDPRQVTSQSKIDEEARLKTMWNGYAFAVDFREERGHAYMLEDQTLTKRQDVVQQPGTCLHCHASVYVPYKKLGDGDLIRGFEEMNKMPFREARKLVEHPVACIDCHDPADMSLRVTRPGFIEGIRALKAREGVKDYDVNKQATPKEMRAFVCGQCHVEYYFKGADKRLVYPWANGLRVDDILRYYDEVGHKDWIHKDTGAAVLKAQHPEFEIWSQGIHARSGVTCVDCHMPQTELEGATVTDHWVRSPLLNIKASCLCCHRWSEAEMKARAEEIQDRFHAVRDRALDALASLITDLKAAKDAGKSDADLATARNLQRHAQFQIDFVEAENSTGFHAPGEELRILAQAIDLVRQGQVALRGQR
jgi:nitrite reductase (cytochrome c-552)